jgi:hypothetical protein
MNTFRWLAMFAAGAVILLVTQIPLAATLQTRADYAAAIDRATAEYENALIECDPIAGHDKIMCVVVAKAAEKRAKATAEANYLGTIKAKADSRIANADANWMIARTACDAKRPPAKDVCVSQAKDANIKLVADANATYTK